MTDMTDFRWFSTNCVFLRGCGAHIAAIAVKAGAIVKLKVGSTQQAVGSE
jgi:hypothetical protein